jgi:hydroxypyruvate reductase
VARRQVERLRQAVREGDDEGTSALVWGGETTVTVTGDGTGGRNQELALAAALALADTDRPAAFLSGGTDGIDGPTDAAGAVVTPDTVRRARRQGLDPQAALAANDAYAFFDAVGGHLKPGPTHTNVMDVQVGLVGRQKAG